MASKRKKRRKIKRIVPPQRDTIKPQIIARRSSRLRRPAYKLNLMETIDRREYFPSISTKERLTDGRPVTYKIHSGKGNARPRARIARNIAYTNPKRTAVCVRRNARRQSLFAIKKIGRGRGSFTKPRKRNETSNIRC